MFSCESIIVICIVLIVFLSGICAVLLNVNYFVEYDETVSINNGDSTYFSNTEVMRVAEVLGEIIE